MACHFQYSFVYHKVDVDNEISLFCFFFNFPLKVKNKSLQLHNYPIYIYLNGEAAKFTIDCVYFWNYWVIENCQTLKLRRRSFQNLHWPQLPPCRDLVLVVEFPDSTVESVSFITFFSVTLATDGCLPPSRTRRVLIELQHDRICNNSQEKSRIMTTKHNAIRFATIQAVQLEIVNKILITTLMTTAEMWTCIAWLHVSYDSIPPTCQIEFRQE